MNAIVTLIDQSSNTIDEVLLEDIKDKEDFSYLDNQDGECHITAKNGNLDFIRKTGDHTLEIHANKTKMDLFVESEVGRIKIDSKVVDFIFDNDILEMHYQIDSDFRIFRIQYQ